jgi:hypothetical protein
MECRVNNTHFCGLSFRSCISQDTGGFFVALLRKVKPLSAAEASGQPAPPASSPSAAELAAGSLGLLPSAAAADSVGAACGLKPAVARRRLMRRDPEVAAAAVAAAAAAAAAAVAAAAAAKDDDDGGGGGGAGGADSSLAAVAAGHPLVSLAVHVAPAGLLAFAKGSLCVASAGLPVAEYQTQMAQKKAAASVPKGNAR